MLSVISFPKVLSAVPLSGYKKNEWYVFGHMTIQ